MEKTPDFKAFHQADTDKFNNKGKRLTECSIQAS